MTDMQILGSYWKISRTINQCSPIDGRVDVALLTPRQFIWAETVKTPLPNNQFIDGQQTYKIHIHQSYVDIYFHTGQNKGALFQRFNLKKPDLVSKHICNKDHYLSTLHIHSKNDLTLIHKVTGPHKNYLMETHYTRIK